MSVSSATGQLYAETETTPVSSERVLGAKAAYTTRRVDLRSAAAFLVGDARPCAGDLLLARVERLGQHSRIELPSGRRAQLHTGDEIVACYGGRYAPDQFEARVPGDLGPCDLVAGGGLAATCVSSHSRMDRPTRLQPLGILINGDGRRINLADFALAEAPEQGASPPLLAVVGAMMNSGKTTCAAHLVRGLKRRGLRVGAAKATGTGSGGDRWTLADAGADMVLDFTDAGFPSTFGLSASKIETIFELLTAHLAAYGADVIVVEIADGLFQPETAALLRSERFRARCDGLVFAASDPLGASAGAPLLEALGHRVLAISGRMTASPLAVRETKRALKIPVLTTRDLAALRRLELPPSLAPNAPSRIAQLPSRRGVDVLEFRASA